MVAQLSNEICLDAWLSPGPEHTDSDEVVVALQAARALEMDGDVAGAMRWLRNAIDAAEQDGDNTRVLALASAAADLASTLRPTVTLVAPKPHDVDPPSAAPPVLSSIRPTPPRPSLPPTSPPPAAEATSRSMPPPVPPPRAKATPSSSIPPHRVPSPEATASNTALARDGRGAGPVAIRVGLRLADDETDILVIRRLRPGQSLEPGLQPALLVLDADVGDPFDPKASK